MSETIPDNDSSTKPKEQSNTMSSTICLPAPPPFDPLTMSSTSAAAGVGESIVPDLMRIYESLTQSKTPDIPPHIPQQQSESKRKVAPGTYVPQPGHYKANELNAEGYIDYSSTTGKGKQFCNEKSATMVPPFQQQTPYSYQAVPDKWKRSPLPYDDPSRVEVEATYSSTGSVEFSYGVAKRRKNNRKDDKNSKEKDGRWSKRFTWPEDLHRDFVAAIFDVGLKHSSPSTVLEQMAPHEQVTTERVKSHLQKYRLHRQKSKKEFMTDFESTLQRLKQNGYEGIDTLSGGKVAGQVAYATMTNQSTNAVSKAANPDTINKLVTEKEKSVLATLPDHKGTNPDISPEMLVLPRLTEDEKTSPIGASMGYLMGLFFSLKQQLEMQRQQQEIQAQQRLASKAVAEASINLASQSDIEQQNAAARVYDSFVKGLPGSTPTECDSTLDPPSVKSNPAVTQSQSAMPSTRNNLEENNLMKQEMKNQMAFQSKMRALKRQEQNKYKTQLNYAAAQDTQDNSPRRSGQPQRTLSRSESSTKPSNEHSGKITPPAQPQEAQEQYHYMQQQENEVTASYQYFQGAGDIQTDDMAGSTSEPRQYPLSMGEDDDFWNTDVVDDQLFQFLMET